MKTVKTFLILAFLGSLLMASCSKKNDPLPTLPRTDLLTAHPWNFSKVTTSSLAGSLLISSLTSALSGSQYTFNLDGTYSGIVLDQPTAGTWVFSQNETQLILDAGTANEKIYQIQQLSDTKLEVSTTLPNTTTVYTVIYVQ